MTLARPRRRTRSRAAGAEHALERRRCSASVSTPARSSSRGHETLGLVEQREQQVLDVDLRVPVAQRLGLRVVQRLLGLLGQRFGSMRSPRAVGSLVAAQPLFEFVDAREQLARRAPRRRSSVPRSRRRRAARARRAARRGGKRGTRSRAERGSSRPSCTKRAHEIGVQRPPRGPAPRSRRRPARRPTRASRVPARGARRRHQRPLRGSKFDAAASCSKSSRSCSLELLGDDDLDDRVEVALAPLASGRPSPRSRRRRPLDEPAGTVRGARARRASAPRRWRRAPPPTASPAGRCGGRGRRTRKRGWGRRRTRRNRSPDGPPPMPGLALAGESDALAVAHAARDVDLEVAPVASEIRRLPPAAASSSESSSTASWSAPRVRSRPRSRWRPPRCARAPPNRPAKKSLKSSPPKSKRRRSPRRTPPKPSNPPKPGAPETS